MKTASTFFGPDTVAHIRGNIQNAPQLPEAVQTAIREAEPFLCMSDEEIWQLMPSHTITRSWMVWSDGRCPQCGEDVRMYFWRHDPERHPWKVECPHCHALFPKNDFWKFYQSGLDRQGIFRRENADESLLYNEEDPSGALRDFGVDDGEGYRRDGHCWRFIGNYLIYSRWKKQVVGGLKALSTAYLYTGDTRYAHKAGVLLDRVADLLPFFDFDREGLVYELPHTAEGYVSYCIDSTTEIKELVLAYDRVFPAIREDRSLVEFLKQKGLETGWQKPDFSAVQENIESRILREVLAHPEKIRSNPPHTELTQLVIQAVLGCPEEEILTAIGKIVENNTQVDGVQGEKGVAGYSAMSTKGLALLLTEFLDYGEGFFARLMAAYPILHQTFRFHIDTWCLHQQYYPGTGDGSRFAVLDPHYYAVDFSEPRMFTLFWKLYQTTGDRDFLKILYRENGFSVEGLPHDLRAENGKQIQEEVARCIREDGPVIQLNSLNKENFCLAILRGESEAYAMWMDYAYCGGHAQSAGMTIGMYAKGLDLMPDFGYPPVMFGGWQTPQALWYRLPSAHNTVMVDGRYQRNNSRGRTTLWGIGRAAQVMRMDGKNLADIPQFERTVLMVPIEGEEFYAVDSFKVVGGKDHAKFTYSHFGTVQTGGLNLRPGEDYGFGSMIDQTAADPFPVMGWYADWEIFDRHHIVNRSDIHFRCTDFTRHTTAQIGRAWICMGEYAGEDMRREEAYIPAVISRRTIQNDLMLSSNFLSLLEAYEGCRNIVSARRLDLSYPNGIVCTDMDSCLEIQTSCGQEDFIVLLDSEDVIYNKFCKDPVVTQLDWGYESDAEVFFARQAEGVLQSVYACGLTYFRIGDLEYRCPAHCDILELRREDGKWQVLTQKETENYVQRNC